MSEFTKEELEACREIIKFCAEDTVDIGNGKNKLLDKIDEMIKFSGKSHTENLKSMSGVSFWRYVIKNKDFLKVICDNDKTSVGPIIQPEPTEYGTDYDYADATDYIGDSCGIHDLLAAIGITSEGV